VDFFKKIVSFVDKKNITSCCGAGYFNYFLYLLICYNCNTVYFGSRFIWAVRGPDGGAVGSDEGGRDLDGESHEGRGNRPATKKGGRNDVTVASKGKRHPKEDQGVATCRVGEGIENAVVKNME